MSETRRVKVHDVTIFGLPPDILQAVLPLSEQIVRLQDALSEALKELGAFVPAFPESANTYPEERRVYEVWQRLSAVLSQPSDSVEP